MFGSWGGICGPRRYLRTSGGVFHPSHIGSDTWVRVKPKAGGQIPCALVERILQRDRLSWNLPLGPQQSTWSQQRSPDRCLKDVEGLVEDYGIGTFLSKIGVDNEQTPNTRWRQVPNTQNSCHLLLSQLAGRDLEFWCHQKVSSKDDAFARFSWD